jgi:hypothetical protein
VRESVVDYIFAGRIKEKEIVIKMAQLETGNYEREKEKNVFKPCGQLVFNKLMVSHYQNSVC